MVNDGWLTSNFGGIYTDEDVRRALKFDTREHAEDVLEFHGRMGGDGRESGVIEECR